MPNFNEEDPFVLSDKDPIITQIDVDEANDGVHVDITGNEEGFITTDVIEQKAMLISMAEGGELSGLSSNLYIGGSTTQELTDFVETGIAVLAIAEGGDEDIVHVRNPWEWVLYGVGVLGGVIFISSRT
jgi:hypothetical protein